jgi:hypothetical protein
MPGQALYRSEAQPEVAIRIVIENEDPDARTIERWRIPDGT